MVVVDQQVTSAFALVRRIVWCGTESGTILLYNAKTHVVLKEIRNQSVGVGLVCAECGVERRVKRGVST